MKNLLSLAFIVAFLGITITSCNTETEEKLVDKILFAEGGELLGLSLGDTKESVRAKLPEEAFEEEYEGFMYYSWKIDNNDYYLDLYFNEDNTLFSISGYVYMNTAEGAYDNEGAKALYEDMKPLFTEKFGAPTSEDTEYMTWSLEDKDVDLGLGDGEVYFYVAQIYDFGDFEFDLEEGAELDSLLMEEMVEEAAN